MVSKRKRERQSRNGKGGGPGFRLAVLLATAAGAAGLVWAGLSAHFLQPDFELPAPSRLRLQNLASQPIFLSADASQSTTGVAFIHQATLTPGCGQESVAVSTAHVSSEFFSILGIEPRLGRAFIAAEKRYGCGVALLSQRIWRDNFHLDSGVLGSKVQLDKETYRIIGVLPAAAEDNFYNWLEEVDVWILLGVSQDDPPPPVAQAIVPGIPA